MMPKLRASHTGLYWMVVMLFAGALLAGFSASAQFDWIDEELDDVEEEEAIAIALLRLRNFRATPTFATDGDADVDIPLVALTWTNPPSAIVDSGVYQLAMYKSTNTYPTGPLDGIRIALPPDAEAYLDRDVLAGETYYYTLIGDLAGNLPDYLLERYPDAIIGEFPQMRYAKTTAGQKAPSIFTNSFGWDLLLGERPAFDLRYCQITIRPVGPPLAPLGEVVKGADYTAYEATVKRNVNKMPVARRDADGVAYSLAPLAAHSLLEINLGNYRFPFFGVAYDKLYLSKNGYIAFSDFFRGLDAAGISLLDLLDVDDMTADVIEILDFASLAGHFMVPRISFLFTEFDFQSGGDAWGRMLDDRVVITFENVKAWGYNPYFAPVTNNVQLELFFSGKIRITYLDAGPYFGVVGISDGRGAPVDPTQVFDDVEPAYGLTDFISLPTAPSRLSINPVAPPVVMHGEEALFLADALAPEGSGFPFFTAVWDNEGPAPFADIGGGVGKFAWQTDFPDRGVHTVRVLANLDGMRAYQDVSVIVNSGIVPPAAIDLLLSSNTEDENPAVSRAVDAGKPLIASYTYYHPYRKQLPMLYEEGLYILYWFRNDQLVAAFTNHLSVPSNVPQPGDRWRFQVTPITVSFIFGEPANSPVVSIVALPEIDAILPAEGLTIGGDIVTIRGRYLSNPLSVKFGGVAATGIRAVSDTELVVTTPLHPAGLVAVTVETQSGVGRRADAFSFVGDSEDEAPDDADDKNIRILGCGSGSAAVPGGNVLLALLVLVVLCVAARRQQEIIG